MTSPIVCVECLGRVDRDEGGPFLWFPLEESEPCHLTAYPLRSDEACCGDVDQSTEEAA